MLSLDNSQIGSEVGGATTRHISHRIERPQRWSIGHAFEIIGPLSHVAPLKINDTRGSGGL